MGVSRTLSPIKFKHTKKSKTKKKIQNINEDTETKLQITEETQITETCIITTSAKKLVGLWER